MPRRKLSVQKRLARALASLDAKDPRYPNLPRSAYAISQQYAKVGMNPRLTRTSRGISTIINYGDRQYDLRKYQLRAAAARLMAAGGAG